MLVRDGIMLRKYWFSISDAEQERRFQQRAQDPLRRWKLSPMDIESRARWVDYSRAKDEMFLHTHTPEAPWYTVEGDDKRRARLTCIGHLLGSIDYQDVLPPPIKLPPLPKKRDSYKRPPRDANTILLGRVSPLLRGGRAPRRARARPRASRPRACGRSRGCGS